ncbi:pyruvate synthase subunit PorD [Clostridium tepidiprofundi DSM 19306]|uniref:Pyruvate synthase subunit PorD n=1 Tax=Clostridium tepidiprofundi DSM 19306 TaxID=1121338 RepID=A0A151B482_9CLOT|nr:4Fe-4S binding protein [Clostridium tepidiprofundi]KYH34600.1 pyruvate synthase subunit PorD [Clostridium tepidiprofundi DSM 19306]
MNRPGVVKFQQPKTIDEYPIGSTCKAGHLVDKNAGWRTFKPVINYEKCVNCFRCFLLCPDGVIDKSEGKPVIDYDFCKGCGVCANECKLGAITMEKEA